MNAILVRGAIALGLAGATIAGLHFVLRDPAVAESVATVEPTRPPYVTLPPAIPRGRTLLCYLAAPDRELPQRVGPVARILPDGLVVLERPAPLPDGPVAGAWDAAGIVLPTRSLGELGPVARAAFLELWLAWSGDGDIPLGVAGVPWGLTIEDGELQRLSRWLR